MVSALVALGLIICDTLTYQMGVMDEYETSEKLSKVHTIHHIPSPTFLNTNLNCLPLLMRDV